MTHETPAFTPAPLLRHHLVDGRTIGYSRYGLCDGLPVLALHGTPGSRLRYAGADRAARDHGLSLICPDRWGYGATPAPQQRSLAAFAGEFADFMVALGYPRFAVIGTSGGAPYAAAMAAVRPEQVTALALTSPVADLIQERIAPGITPFHRLSFLMLPRLPGANRLLFSAFRLGLRWAPDLTLRMADLRAGTADQAIMANGETRAAVARNFRAGLATGCDGAVIDMTLFSRRWEFDPAAIGVPTRLWIGDQDTNVPIGLAISLAGRIRGCELTVVRGAGHHWGTANYPGVFAWVAQAANASGQGE